MLKHLAIIGLLLAAMSPMPGQTVKSAAQGGDKGQNQSQGEQAAPTPTLTLINKPIDPGAAKPNGQPVTGEDKEHSVKLTSLPPVTLTNKPKTFWDHVLDWGPWVFNFGLVIVGILQVVLLKRTWKTIERQTAFQEANMTQWVEVEFTHLSIKEPDGGWPKEPLKTVDITLYAKAVNRTPLPLTVYKIATRISRTLEWEEFETDEETLLPPIKDGIESSYPFFVPLDLDEVQTKELLAHDFHFSVGVRVFFVEASRRKTDQRFTYILCCAAPDSVVTLSYMGKAPIKLPKNQHAADES